jgi:hypothetical protein
MERLAEEKLPLEYPFKTALKIYGNRLLWVLAAFLLALFFSIVLGIAKAFPIIGFVCFLTVVLLYLFINQSFKRFFGGYSVQPYRVVKSPRSSRLKKLSTEELSISEELADVLRKTEELAVFLGKDRTDVGELIKQWASRTETDLTDTTKIIDKLISRTEKTSVQNQNVENRTVPRDFQILFNQSKENIYMSKDLSPKQKEIMANEIDKLMNKFINLSSQNLPYNISQTDEVQQ